MLMSANSWNSLVTKSGLVTSHVPLLQTPPTQEVPSGRFRGCDSPDSWNGWHTESLAWDLQQVLQSLSSVQKHWIMLWSSQKLKHFKEVLFSLGEVQEPLCVCMHSCSIKMLINIFPLRISTASLNTITYQTQWLYYTSRALEYTQWH